MLKKILVVDDQYGIRLLLKELFKADNLLVYQASNGYQALDIAAAELPDVILLDLHMPGMDGIEFLTLFSKLGTKAKVIIMTGYDDDNQIPRAFNLGALAHFTKPFDIQELRSEVMRQLELKDPIMVG